MVTLEVLARFSAQQLRPVIARVAFIMSQNPVQSAKTVPQV